MVPRSVRKRKLSGIVEGVLVLVVRRPQKSLRICPPLFLPSPCPQRGQEASFSWARPWPLQETHALLVQLLAHERGALSWLRTLALLPRPLTELSDAAQATQGSDLQRGQEACGSQAGPDLTEVTEVVDGRGKEVLPGSPYKDKLDRARTEPPGPSSWRMLRVREPSSGAGMCP